MSDELKKESERLAGLLREKYLSNTKDVAERIQIKYERDNKVLSYDEVKENFSEHIKNLVELEKNEFNLIINEIEESWLKKYKSQEIKLDEIDKIINQLITAEKSEHNNLNLFYEFNRLTAEIQRYIVYSNKQSSKSRAGSCFEHHLSYLFRILDMRFDDQVNLGTSSETFDFIFPDENYLNKNPNACMLVEAQTTINDRFRLTTGKGDVVKGAQRFLMTLTGLGIISERDKNFLTPAKLDELRDKRVSLIVHKDVKKSLKRKDIYSFEDFFSLIYSGKMNIWDSKE